MSTRGDAPRATTLAYVRADAPGATTLKVSTRALGAITLQSEPLPVPTSAPESTSVPEPEPTTVLPLWLEWQPSTRAEAPCATTLESEPTPASTTLPEPEPTPATTTLPEPEPTPATTTLPEPEPTPATTTLPEPETPPAPETTVSPTVTSSPAPTTVPPSRPATPDIGDAAERDRGTLSGIVEAVRQRTTLIVILAIAGLLAIGVFGYQVFRRR